MMIDGTECLTGREAAELLGISYNAFRIRRCRDTLRIEPLVKVGQTDLYALHDVKKVMK